MSRKRGFTLIELLVVVLILAILMAVALPLYLNAVRDSQLKTCRSNMQTIANAVHAAYVASGGTTTYDDMETNVANAAGSLHTMLPDLGAADPICPSVGAASYTIVAPADRGGGEYGVVCSFGGPDTGTGTVTAHGEFVPGADAK